MKVLNSIRKQMTFSVQMRWASTMRDYKLKDEVENLINEQKIKPKNHPGIIPYKDIHLPQSIIKEIKNNLKNVDSKLFPQESKSFSNFLKTRKLPAEQNELIDLYLDIERNQLPAEVFESSEEVLREKRLSVKRQVLKTLKTKVYNWRALDYNKSNCLLYAVSRSPSEYSALTTIFNEIKTRDSDFKPERILDFGSGVGTVLWAANNIWNKIQEYVGVDISTNMHDLSHNIIKKTFKTKGLFYRQFIPLSVANSDIVVSAYSLMELPSAKQRLLVLHQLWKKTKNYLVIVEHGTNAGFKVINEAREYINYVSNRLEFDFKYFIFAPCPQKIKCPRITELQNRPCNFISQYLPFYNPQNHEQELFSYIVFKKGKPSENDDWCRVVDSSVVRSGMVKCNLCLSNGKLETAIFTKKNKILYQCARKTGWGDRLPIKSSLDAEISKESNENLNFKKLANEVLTENEKKLKLNYINVNKFVSDIEEKSKPELDRIESTIFQIIKENQKKI